MKLLRAERIIGFDISMTTSDAGWIAATATHPDYKYTVNSEGRDLSEVLGRLVNMNYKTISAIVREEQKFRCFECARLVPLEIDHINMRSKGRDDRRSNLRGLGTAMSCGCHSRRHGYKP